MPQPFTFTIPAEIEALPGLTRLERVYEDTVRRMGIDDPDLEPLWREMRDTTWKRTG
jgi:hypothetical protein